MYRTFLSLAATVVLMGACQEDFDKRLLRETKEYTARHCPQAVESGTRLDSLTYDPKGKVYTMWYSLSSVNEEIFYENSSIVRPQLIERVQTDDKTKTIREHDVNFRFVYRAQRNDSIIYDTVVTPGEYRK